MSSGQIQTEKGLNEVVGTPEVANIHGSNIDAYNNMHSSSVEHPYRFQGDIDEGEEEQPRETMTEKPDYPKNMIAVTQ